MKKRLKIGIIGPTNMGKLLHLTGKPLGFFLKKAEVIGQVLAQLDCELWVNSDGGMINYIARSYQKHGGKRLVMLYPRKGEPWPNTHTKVHLQHADILSPQRNWFWANYAVVTIPDICLCVGLSAGTLSELAYIKWNCQFSQGNMKKLFAVRELIRGGHLPLEIEVEVRHILAYVKKANGLTRVFKKLSQ